MKHFFKTPTIAVIILVLTGMMMSGCDNNKKSSTLQSAKIYVANEEGSSVSVIELQDSFKVTNIDISGNSHITNAICSLIIARFFISHSQNRSKWAYNCG